MNTLYAKIENNGDVAVFNDLYCTEHVATFPANYSNKPKTNHKSVIINCVKYNLNWDNVTDRILVRTGHGNFDGNNFDDVITIVHKVQKQHHGWRSITYNGQRYQVLGGIRTQFFICLNNPTGKGIKIIVKHNGEVVQVIRRTPLTHKNKTVIKYKNKLYPLNDKPLPHINLDDN